MKVSEEFFFHHNRNKGEQHVMNAFLWVLLFLVVLVSFSPNRFPIAPTHIGPLSATCDNIRSQ